MVSREEKREKPTVTICSRRLRGAFSQDFEDETERYNERVLEGRTIGSGKRMHREVLGQDYKPEMLTLWVEENRHVMQDGISWLQGLKNYSQ